MHKDLNELSAVLTRVIEGPTGDTDGYLADLKMIESWMDQNKNSADPQLIHFLGNRSYVKAASYLKELN